MNSIIVVKKLTLAAMLLSQADTKMKDMELKVDMDAASSLLP